MTRFLLHLIWCVLAASACSSEGAPGPFYDALGPACVADRECSTGYCCTSKDCKEGRCAFRCDDDRDCAPGTLCEGHTCFTACASDYHCAPGQRCRHDHTVCQH